MNQFGIKPSNKQSVTWQVREGRKTGLLSSAADPWSLIGSRDRK